VEKIKRFIECTVPISNCNLKCGYCYVIQENRRNSHVSKFNLSPSKMMAAFNAERWGGICYFSLCGFGETMLHKDIVDIASAILSQGHYVNITTNGTISVVIDKLLDLPDEYLKRLNLSISFHYNELVRLNLLEVFIENVKKIKGSMCSFIVQLNLCDEYIPVLDEIKEISLNEFGALPQLALTRNESTKSISVLSDLDFESYCDLGNTFESKLFDMTTKNFMVKRKEFCYAGEWSFKLDIASGELRRCYFSKPHQNIYDNVNEKIILKPIGNGCRNPYCVNSSHFMTLGVIPSIKTPTYAECRNRICNNDGSEWLKPQMKEFLSGKLSESNREYSFLKRQVINLHVLITDMCDYLKKIASIVIRKLKNMIFN